MNLGGIIGGLQGVGDAGGQFGQAALDAQSTKIRNLLASLKMQEGTVNLDDAKERLRRLKLQPDTQEAQMQQQIEAAEKILNRKLTDSEKQVFVLGAQGKQGPQNTGSIKDRLEQGLAALPDEQRKIVEPAIRAYMDAGEYDKAIQVFSSVAEKFQSEPRHAPAILTSKSGTPYGMRVGNKDIVPGSPEWNEGYQKVLDSAVSAAEKDAAEKRKIEETKRRAALAKEVRGQTSRQMENTFRDYDAATKILAPFDRIADVASRAQEYVQAPSGPGDVALMLAYVEATKPQTGFRFTTAEQNMIKTSRGWVEGAQAKVQGGFTGILFGDEQRKIIGDIIQSAGDSVEERRNTYLRGILRINPKLYNILTGTPDEGGPPPAPPLPPGAVAVTP